MAFIHRIRKHAYIRIVVSKGKGIHINATGIAERELLLARDMISRIECAKKSMTPVDASVKDWLSAYPKAIRDQLSDFGFDGSHAATAAPIMTGRFSATFTVGGVVQPCICINSINAGDTFKCRVNGSLKIWQEGRDFVVLRCPGSGRKRRVVSSEYVLTLPTAIAICSRAISGPGVDAFNEAMSEYFKAIGRSGISNATICLSLAALEADAARARHAIRRQEKGAIVSLAAIEGAISEIKQIPTKHRAKIEAAPDTKVKPFRAVRKEAK